MQKEKLYQVLVNEYQQTKQELKYNFEQSEAIINDYKNLQITNQSKISELEDELF